MHQAMVFNVLSQPLLPVGAAKLGCLVNKVNHPQHSRHEPLAGEEPKALESTTHAFRGSRSFQGSQGVGAAFLALLSATLSRRTGIRTTVNTDCFKTYLLDDVDGWFEKITKLEDTQRWIERALDRKRKLYLITGLYTITDATIRQDAAFEDTAGLSLQFRGTQIISGTGTPVPASAIADAMVEMKVKEDRDESAVEFTVAKEYICGLQYRKISHRWLSGKSVENTRLEGKVRTWSSLETMRAWGQEERLETWLEDVDGHAELEQVLGSEWQIQVVEGGVPILHSDHSD